MADNSFPQRVFIDDKFDVLVEEFLKRKWSLTDDKEACDFLFTNLRNIAFSYTFPDKTIINHLKGSHHLSNKVL